MQAYKQFSSASLGDTAGNSRNQKNEGSFVCINRFSACFLFCCVSDPNHLLEHAMTNEYRSRFSPCARTFSQYAHHFLLYSMLLT